MACQAGATAIVIDSLGTSPSTSTTTESAATSTAPPRLPAEGIDVPVYHHQNKGDGTSKPKEPKHVYGSSMITNGAGSVVPCGRRRRPVVELGHLWATRQPGRFSRVVHDHDHGTSSVHDRFDAVAYMRHAGPHGVTSATSPEPCSTSLTPPRTRSRRPAESSNASTGLASSCRSGTFGGEGGSQADCYHLVDRTHEDHAQ